MICYGIILPIIPLEMETRYHKSQSVTGLLFAMFSAGCLIGTPIVGVLSDRIGRRTPFLIGMAMLAGSTMLFAYGRHLAILFIARFVQGLSSAVAWVVGLALIADIYSNEQFGVVSGTVIGGNTIGALVGPIIGGVTYEHFGYLVPFYISAIFVLLDLMTRVLLVDDGSIKLHKQLKDRKGKEITQLIDDNGDIRQDILNDVEMAGADVADPQRDGASISLSTDDHVVVQDQEDEEDVDVDQEQSQLNQTSQEGDEVPVQTESEPINHAIINSADHEVFDEIHINGVEDSVDEPMNEREFFKMIMKRLDVWMTLSSIILFAIGMSSLEPLLPLLIQNKFHRSTSVTSLLFASFIFPFLVLSPLSGYLTDKNYVSRTKMSFAGAVVTAVAFPFIDRVSHLSLLFIDIIVIGGGLAVFFNPIIPILTYIVDPTEKGTHNGKILSMFCIFYSFGIFIGPIYSTLLDEHVSFFSFTMSFSVLILVNAIVFLIYFLRRPTSVFEANAAQSNSNHHIKLRS
ncbi:hypothetical protein SAMD00019534_039920 [Acytostelium subglobosum LB1]|uniref:hypothetical protein n=1 Tax=Acytostelium subglobosum LB1 TaxID=1410327 RepID=UPI000644B33B|nr:hypothetical protein SAMD00019534_039920 [Acytostelium subglobosum LB1]GAM20817.1 hypothetical protein SAMD00019534_039920 [Acytostelium subglobosum LB1]|eukprot:XP_012755951.1 hypothetical protein SAMD00019534_039920 [Acytostelium subglobosum LB1]